MPNIQQTLEIERIVNLASGFGWVKVAEEVTEEKMVITIEKPIESPAVSGS